MKFKVIVMISLVVCFLFCTLWFESSLAIKNVNSNSEDDQYDYIFDSSEYFESDELNEENEEVDNNFMNDNNIDKLEKDFKVSENGINNNFQEINTINKTAEKEDEDTISSNNRDYNLDYVDDEDNLDIKDKLLVKTRINLMNLEKQGFLTIAAFINGQELLKNVSLNEVEGSKKFLNVNLAVNKKTDIVQAGDRDEFFVCAYHVEDLTKEYDSLTYFDCDEGDLQNPDKPSISRLFSPSSLVFQESKNIYNNSTNKLSQSTTLINTDANNNEKQIPLQSQNVEHIQKEDQNKKEQVKIKVFAPLEDRKTIQKIKMVAMVKGQFKTAVINNLQEEFDKNGQYTISRTFIFDRNTDVGKIQIGDKFFACVSSSDLNPPEGTECEKRIVKNLERENVLYAR
ncbi:MAG: hypothetical protein ACE5SW_11535 [Nitrososphaeraceae archaeon]